MAFAILNPDSLVSNSGWAGTPNHPDIFLNIDGGVFSEDGPTDFDLDDWVDSSDSASVFRVGFDDPQPDTVWTNFKFRMWFSRITGDPGTQTMKQTMFADGEQQAQTFVAQGTFYPGGGLHISTDLSINLTSAQLADMSIQIEFHTNPPWLGNMRVTALQAWFEGLLIANETNAQRVLVGGSAVIRVPLSNHRGTGGAIAGGTSDVTQISNPTPTGGAKVSGDGRNTFSDTATGGAISGGIADESKITQPTISGGAISGGVADHTMIMQPIATGGSIVAGVARVVPFFEFGSGGAIVSGIAVIEVIEAPRIPAPTPVIHQHFGNVFDFDGFDDQLQFGRNHKAHHLLTDDVFSVSVWCRPTSASGDHVIAAQHDGTSGWKLEWKEVTASNMRFDYDLDGASIQTIKDLPVNEWWHICCVFKAVDDTNDYQQQLWVNGCLESESNVTGHIANTEIITIGASNDADYFDGMLKDFRFYKKGLEVGEIEDIYHKGSDLYRREFQAVSRLAVVFSETGSGGLLAGGTVLEIIGGVLIGGSALSFSTRSFSYTATGGVTVEDSGATVQTSFHTLQGDALRIHYTGAATDGDIQSNQSASLGDFRAKTQTEAIGFLQSSRIQNITVLGASGNNGIGFGSLVAVDENRLAYTAPDSNKQGAPVTIDNLQIRPVADGADVNKFVRVQRNSANDMTGFSNLSFVKAFNNIFGMDNSQNAQTVSGGDRYRAVMIENGSVNTATNVSIWVKQLLPTVQIATAGLSASGAGTIVALPNTFCDYPTSGWCRVEDLFGVFREIVYFSSRTDAVLTVSSDGRSRLGSSATAGASDDRLILVPPIRIADEASSPVQNGSIQTIADELTAPAGVSWTTEIDSSTGILVGTIDIGEQFGLWIHRELPTNSIAIAQHEVAIGISFTWESVTYDQTMFGFFRAAQDNLNRFELHIGTNDQQPDLTATPDETFTSLPHTTTTTFAADDTYHLIVNKRNVYNMVSQDISATEIDLDASGDEILTKPSAPEIVSWEATTAGKFLLTAVYFIDADATNVQADSFNIYTTFGGVDPLLTDTPTNITFDDLDAADGLVLITFTTSVQATDTIGKVMATVARSLDSVESLPSDIATAVNDDVQTSGDRLRGFYRELAESIDQ